MIPDVKSTDLLKKFLVFSYSFLHFFIDLRSSENVEVRGVARGVVY